MEVSDRLPDTSLKFSRPLDPNAGSFFPGRQYHPTRKSPPCPPHHFSRSLNWTEQPWNRAIGKENSHSRNPYDMYQDGPTDDSYLDLLRQRGCETLENEWHPEQFNCDTLLEALTDSQTGAVGKSILQDVKDFMEKKSGSPVKWDDDERGEVHDRSSGGADNSVIVQQEEEHAIQDEEEDDDEPPREGPDLEIFRRLAQINGAINRMSCSEIRRRLIKLHLNGAGNREVISRRLKDFYKKKKQAQMTASRYRQSRTYYDYLLIVDFEATCEEPNPGDLVHEIIEFPAVLLDLKTKEIESEFQEYVKPEINPTLSSFCKELTGISQETVDNSDTFAPVFQRFEEWLSKRKHGPHSNFALVTDGTSDLAKFLYMQCKSSQVTYPQYARKWINVKKMFSTHYKLGKNPLSVMLAQCGLKFEGRPHCGLHDAQNIAQLVLRLMEDGATMCVNEYLIIQSVAKASKKAPNLRQLWSEVRVVPVTRNQAIRFVKEERILAEATE